MKELPTLLLWLLLAPVLFLLLFIVGFFDNAVREILISAIEESIEEIKDEY